MLAMKFAKTCKIGKFRSLHPRTSMPKTILVKMGEEYLHDMPLTVLEAMHRR